MSNKENLLQSKSCQHMVESGARLCQLLGLPRSTGEIYGLLFLSPCPLTLDDMVESLGISKASASTGTRHLISWGAVKQVWVAGERRDYFEVVPDFQAVFRKALQDFIKPRLASSEKRLDDLQAVLEAEFSAGVLPGEHYQVCVQRIRNLRVVHDQLNELAPLAEQFL
jgi:HTH-type transcriptional regulator, glycine betaine synthesis regulator